MIATIQKVHSPHYFLKSFPFQQLFLNLKCLETHVPIVLQLYILKNTEDIEDEEHEEHCRDIYALSGMHGGHAQRVYSP